MSKLGEFVLRRLSHEVQVPDGGEDGAGPNPLGYLLAEYPNFSELVRGKRVLDFGCGYGNQGGAIEAKYGAQVTGLDIDESRLAEARRRYPNVRFLSKIPAGERFDVVISQNAMEHFSDPAGVLEQMKSLVAPGGQILIAFGFPWWSPYGSHMHFFCRIPWLQVWFSERTIMRVRSRYKTDGAARFGEVEGGLNQMSLRKFNRLIRETGLKVYRMEYRAVKKLHFLMRIPLVREYFAGRVIAVLGSESASEDRQTIRRLLMGLCQKESEQERLKRAVRQLVTHDFDLLSKEDQNFILLMKSRVRIGLPILEQHGTKIDDIGAEVSLDRAW